MTHSPARFALLCLAAVAFASTGCARSRIGGAPPLPARAADEATPADPAGLTLDQIEPRPVLDRTSAATQPSAKTRAPVEALVLFAQARDALLAGRRYTAIGALEKAIALDPHSYELYYALGQAYQMGRTYDDRSIEAMEKATAVDPDHLELQTDLGRQYLAKGDLTRAMEHLRLAVQTSQYDTDDSTAAVADYFLARVLQVRGYDRAALQQYARLLERAKDRPLIARRDAGLAFIISDRLQRDVGDLYAKHGLHEYALALYRAAAERDPANVELQTRVVRSLSALGRHGEAVERAADLVVQAHGSNDAVALLREVARAGGDESAADAALRRLHDQRPGDRDVLFALVGLLAERGRGDEADRLLARAADRSDADSDADLVRRRFDLRLNANDLAGAARFLIDTLARQPDTAPELDALWPELVRRGGPRFNSSALVELDVPPAEQAGKWYAASRVAARMLHERAARDALERAAHAGPVPFAPAYRDLMARAWSRPDVDEADKRRRGDELIAAAKASGDAALADELTGLSLLYQKKAAEAVEALGRAVERAGPSPAAVAPDLQHARATAFRRAGDAPRFERTLWTLISDRPAYEDAYLDLYEYYAEAGQVTQAERVLNAWRAALPHSPAARLRQAAADFRAGRVAIAERDLSDLFDEYADEPAVVASVRAFYTGARQPEKFLAKLGERQPREPGNLAVAGALAEAYAQQGRSPDAARVLDAARAAVGNDPDLLYQLSHLYSRAGLDDAGERLLGEVLSLDDSHAPAANDLGYHLAEQGRDLDRAEALARRAVELEPHNGAYLDSLGWVLYKRSKFAEARELLGRAVAASGMPDPVVLDHLADATYRAGDANAATNLWVRALNRLEETGVVSRPDLKDLRASLREKTRQAAAGEVVQVAPVTVEQSAAETQPPLAAQRRRADNRE